MHYTMAKIAIITVFLHGYCGAGGKRFEIGENDFLLDKKPVVLRTGEIHYLRIPREYWQHRLQMCKAMGLNTVCAYLFWNAHEPEPGQFHFSGMADVAEFCRLAQKEGLLVILRPGPYSCAEWDFGGFPYWLLKDETMKLRTRYPGYLAACRRYILRVGEELASLQISKEGPIIMVQVENEYGSYGSDKEYIGILKEYWRDAGFDVPFFTCDGPVQLKNDVRDDLFCVVNFGTDPAGAFKALREVRNSGPLMCGEYYPAWFDHWGVEHHTKETPVVIKDLKYMLDRKISFSLYMAHGGTSFGFTVGANYSDRFQPQTTSYDYDAPISEAGWETSKYQKLRQLFSNYLNPGESIPDIPGRNPVIEIPEMKLEETASLFQHLGTPVETEHPQSLELYGQNQGCALYKTILPPGPAGTVLIPSFNDYGYVYLDGKKMATWDRKNNKGKWTAGANPQGQNSIISVEQNYFAMRIPLPKREKSAALEIFVEALGHINYGAVMEMDRKGVFGNVLFQSPDETRELTGWQAYLFPLNKMQLDRIDFRKEKAELPAFYRIQFTLNKTGDTFLDMRSWGKGMVWVNGYNLGRYWNIGPAQTLYLPGPWLKTGENEIVVLELSKAEKTTVQGLAIPILNQLGK